MRSLVLAGLVLLALARPARAEGYDTHLYRPALDSRGFFTVNGADVIAAGHPSLGLVLDYGRNILRTPGAARIESAFTGTFHFDYGIADRAVIGLSAPVVLMSGPGLDLQSIQHVAVHGKVMLTSPHGPIGIAVAAQVGAPVSDAPESGGADPSVWYWPSLIVEKRFGAHEGVRLGLNAGFRGHGTTAANIALRNGQYRDGNLVTYGAGASVRILEPVDLVLETYGTYLLSSSSAAVKPSNEALGGLKVFVEKSSYLVLGAGPRYTGGFEAADLRATVGFVFEPTFGAARSQADLDLELVDTDGDGIPDARDACPYVKGPRTDNPRTNGCPPIPDPAPEPPSDRDHDGIADAEDACPDSFGKRHPDPKRNGCPDILIGPDTITVFDKILFETASAKILPESIPIVDKVAAAIKEHPELALIEVAGHADERGAERMNLGLTQARVDSVMRALVERDVDRRRLRAKGYGFYCPIEQGHDEGSWSKNRRVEFLIVKGGSGPTGVPLGCANASAHGVKPDPL